MPLNKETKPNQTISHAPLSLSLTHAHNHLSLSFTHTHTHTHTLSLSLSLFTYIYIYYIYIYIYIKRLFAFQEKSGISLHWKMTSCNGFAIFLVFHSKIVRNTYSELAQFSNVFRVQSAGSIEYISAEGYDSANKFPGYNTKQSEGAVSVNLELSGMRSPS